MCTTQYFIVILYFLVINFIFLRHMVCVHQFGVCVFKQGIDGDYYDCIDCIIDFFKTPCKWKADNDVCVNADCEHCADFVSGVQCGKCYLKEIS